MKILITGGTGFIGQALCRALASRQYAIWVYSRRPEEIKGLCGPQVNAIKDLAQLSEVNFDAVVNLAGESIAGGLWTNKRKQKLRHSRIQLTETLCHHLSASVSPPPIFISGSATGFYGNGGDQLLTEETEPANRDFAQQLCEDWEKAADLAADWQARIVKLRIGLVMGPGGGFLSPLKLPFKFGLGGRLGNGQQWMSWISLADIVNVILFTLDHEECDGVFNAVAPNPVTNQEFTQLFAESLGRSAILPAPEFALKLGLGELSTLLLGGQRAVPERLQQAGFQFQHNQLETALKAAL